MTTSRTTSRNRKNLIVLNHLQLRELSELTVPLATETSLPLVYSETTLRQGRSERHRASPDFFCFSEERRQKSHQLIPIISDASPVTNFLQISITLQVMDGPKRKFGLTAVNPVLSKATGQLF
jgi:hypothetical protein